MTIRSANIRAGWILIAAAAWGATACGDDETATSTGDPGDPTGCVDYSTVASASCCDGGFATDGSCSSDLVPCSFEEHLMPIMQRACNFSTCHGEAAAAPEEDLELGPEVALTASQEDLDRVYNRIVGVDANRSDLKLIEPGDPTASFLQAKSEYRDFTVCASNACDSTLGCGERMPQGQLKLPDHERAMFAAWIKDGAENN